MSKLRSKKNKDEAKASMFLSSFTEFKDKDMLECVAWNELFLEIRLEILREAKEKNDKIN